MDPHPPAAPAPPRHATALVADPDAAVRRVERHVLEGIGFDVVEADTGAAAVRAGEARPGGVDLLVADLDRPPADGPTVAGRLARANPDLLVLYAPAGGSPAGEGGLGPDAAVLPKPFTARELAGAVRGLVAGVRAGGG